jgi:hypothetical protein
LPDSRKTSFSIEGIQCIVNKPSEEDTRYAYIFNDDPNISAEVEIEIAPKVSPKPKLKPKILRKSLAINIKSNKTPIIIKPKITFDSNVLFQIHLLISTFYIKIFCKRN